MSFGAPPTVPTTAATTTTPPSTTNAAFEAAAAAVEAVLNTNAAIVSDGSYLAVIPAASLPTLLGTNNATIQEMCTVRRPGGH